MYFNFKKTTAIIGGKTVNGYRVTNLTKEFRGLKIFLKKEFTRWYAYEHTTGKTITPKSWAGGFSNKTRVGILSIVGHFLACQSNERWKSIQKQINYPLKEN